MLPPYVGSDRDRSGCLWVGITRWCVCAYALLRALIRAQLIPWLRPGVLAHQAILTKFYCICIHCAPRVAIIRAGQVHPLWLLWSLISLRKWLLKRPLIFHISCPRLSPLSLFDIICHRAGRRCYHFALLSPWQPSIRPKQTPRRPLDSQWS